MKTSQLWPENAAKKQQKLLNSPWAEGGDGCSRVTLRLHREPPKTGQYVSTWTKTETRVFVEELPKMQIRPNLHFLPQPFALRNWLTKGSRCNQLLRNGNPPCFKNITFGVSCQKNSPRFVSSCSCCWREKFYPKTFSGTIFLSLFCHVSGVWRPLISANV